MGRMRRTAEICNTCAKLDSLCNGYKPGNSNCPEFVSIKRTESRKPENVYKGMV